MAIMPIKAGRIRVVNVSRSLSESLRLPPPAPTVAKLPPPKFLRHDPLLGKVTTDPTGQALHSGYDAFYSPHGVEGLVKTNTGRLELLAVKSLQIGTGQFRAFMEAAKLAYPTICVWLVDNPALAVILARYGFTPAVELAGHGEALKGFRWDRPAPPTKTTKAKRMNPTTDYTTGPTEKRSFVRWTHEELTTLAAAMVKGRIEFPFATFADIFERSQRATLPGERQRTVAGPTAVPELMQAFVNQWMQATQPKTVEAEPPPPQIIEVQVEKEVSYPDLLNRLDLPSLVALVVAKLEKPMGQLLTAMAASNGTQPAAVPALPAVPLPLITNTPNKRLPRIAVVGARSSQFAAMEMEIKKMKLDEKLDVRFVAHDTERARLPVCDKVLINNHVHHRWFALAKETLSSSNIIFVEGNEPAILNKLRDISTQQPK